MDRFIEMLIRIVLLCLILLAEQPALCTGQWLVLQIHHMKQINTRSYVNHFLAHATS
jgi:hypothetical protein